MRRKVYIASPYTLGDVAMNVKRQIDVSNELIDLGFLPFAPLLFHFQHMVHPRSHEQWMDVDLGWLAHCDVVLRLDGESKGADIEVARAKELGIPVMYNLSELMESYKSIDELMEIYNSGPVFISELYPSCNCRVSTTSGFTRF